MSYYIYENWRAGLHKAVIHVGDCRYCNHGQGRLDGQYDRDNAEWSGPFSDLETARRRQKTMRAKEKTECGSCLRRRPLL